MTRLSSVWLAPIVAVALVSDLAAEPRLLLTGDVIQQIHAQQSMPTEFTADFTKAEKRVSPYLHALADIPLPNDSGGGNQTIRLGAGDNAQVPSNVMHGVVCVKTGALNDAFSPVRKEFLEESTPS